MTHGDLKFISAIAPILSPKVDIENWTFEIRPACGLQRDAKTEKAWQTPGDRQRLRLVGQHGMVAHGDPWMTAQRGETSEQRDGPLKAQ